MKLSEAKAFIIEGIKNNFNVVLVGSPGVGKTDIIKECCNEAGMKFHIAHPVTWDATDARGLPAIINNKAEWCPFGDLRIMLEAKEDTVFFLDDIGQSANSVQAAVMQFTLERSINGQKISPHIRFLMATNSRKDGAGVAGILTPLINRFTFINIEPNANDWIEWAKVNNMPIELMGFLRFCPELITTFDPVKFKDQPFASPRSISTLGRWINCSIVNLELWKGVVGEKFAIPFTAFYKLYNELGDLPEKVINNPDSAPIPTKLDQIYALCGALAKRTNNKNWSNIYKYSKRLPDEFHVSFISDTIYLNSKNLKEKKVEYDLTCTTEYIQFCVSHQNVV